MAKKKVRETVCPMCGNEDTTEVGSGFEDMCAYTTHHCANCGAEWEENYSVEYCGYNIRNEDGEIIVYDVKGEAIE